MDYAGAFILSTMGDTVPCDRVIIPTYFRPEYLALCLEHITAAQFRQLEIRVYHDARRVNHVAADETIEVCKRFPVTLTIRKPHMAVGNTLNFLEAYKDAYQSDARYVYLIEDDVLVCPDFFQWHEAIQTRKEFFCSVGWHCIRRDDIKADPSDDQHAYIESAVDFSSIGVCWKREALKPLIAHARPIYYQTPTPYLADAFPGNPIPPGRWVEQAGLIMRLLLEGRGNRVVAWPRRPRCGHIGVTGYHRSKGFKCTGSLDARINQLRCLVASGEMLKLATEFDDINLPPQPKPWSAEDLYVSKIF